MPCRLILVTTELYPETPGGAGVLVDAVARQVSKFRPVTVLLATSTKPVVTERDGVAVIAAAVEEPDFTARSKAVAEAVAQVASPGDRIEFQDFEGIGFFALAYRADLGLVQTTITVRFHGPYDLLAQAMDTAQEDWDIPAAMEREVFRMADQVLVPVEGHRDTLVARYGVEPDRVVIAPPPVDPLPRLEPIPSGRPVFAVVGRLAEVKGSQDAVAAALELLDDGLDLELRFVGGDGWSPTTGTSMSARLQSMIPPHRLENITFHGPVDRHLLPEALADATAVVVASRFESFCLAAHEARSMGLPVIVPDLPAFRGLLTESTGALVYDGTVEGLADAIRVLATEPETVARLKAAPAPSTGDPESVYVDDPEPRHPRSQAGLATAATQTLEALWQSKQQKASVLREFLQSLPGPVAAVLRRAPSSIKRRVKAAASWDEEDQTWQYRKEMKRATTERLDAVRRRIKAGEFREVANPDVTIVIPVYDDVSYLEEALASVYEQSHDSWEIVVVDDGSSSPDAIRYLESLQRPRVQIVRQENRGLPAARNAGMKVARGRYFVPLDSDDQLDPDFLSLMIEALDPKEDAAYAHCYARLHHDIDAIWITRPFNPYWQLLGNGVVGCVLLRREAWEQVGGYDETMTLGNEDWEMWLRLMENRWGQVHVPKVLFKYRKHGISMSVRTEARFEEGRRMVRDRHPRLYEPSRIRRIKERWYPLVTALSDAGLSEDPEIEVIGDVGQLESTWGKFVADVRGIDPLPTALLLRLADLLEAAPDTRSAVTRGLPPVLMTRRWALHDAASGHDGVVTLDDPAEGPEGEIPRLVLRPGWAIPAEVAADGIPVQRQPPEEAGPMPDPSRW